MGGCGRIIGPLFQAIWRFPWLRVAETGRLPANFQPENADLVYDAIDLASRLEYVLFIRRKNCLCFCSRPAALRDIR
jgi:hypothetical protein